MNASTRMRIIRGHLEAVSRGRAPSSEKIGVWLRELDCISDEDLDPCIREARAYHTEACDRGRRWGQLTPDDVLAIWRSQNTARAEREGTAKPPESPGCPLGCESGQVVLVGADGYDFVTVCDCSSGDWWAETSPTTWGRMTRAGVYLQNAQFRLARPVRPPMPRDHVEWLDSRAAQVGHRKAMEEYKRHMERGGEV